MDRGHLRESLLGSGVLAYWLLAVGLSWAYWVPVALAGGTAGHAPGLLGPWAAATLLTAYRGGHRAMHRQLAAMLRWRVPASCWAAALSPLAVGLVAAAVLAPFRGWPTVASFLDQPGLPATWWWLVLVLLLLVNGYGEEVGWRGYAWPRLRQRLPLPTAALVLTVPWAVWHLPTFWIGSGLGDLPLLVVPGWLVGLYAGAVALGWLYERSGSVLVVAVAHTALNVVTASPGGEGVIAAAVSAFVIAAAVLILRADARARRDAALTQRVPLPV